MNLKTAAILLVGCFNAASALSAPDDATHFRQPTRTWMVMPYAEIPTLSVDVETPRDREVAGGNTGDYEPNTTFQFGVRGVYDGWAASVGSGAATVADEEKGRTRFSDIGLSHYTKRFGWHGRLQSYRGMHSSLEDEAAVTADADTITRRPDIRIDNAELNAIYILNPSSFSLKAAFDQGEIQTRSGGSFLAMLSLQHLNIRAEDDLLVPAAVDDDDVDGDGLDDRRGLRRAAATTLSFLPGYGYTQVLPEEHFITAAMMVGGGVQQRVSELDGVNKAELGTGMKVALQVSLGRNADDVLYGFAFNFLSTTARFQGVEVNVTSLPVTFYTGIRI